MQITFSAAPESVTVSTRGGLAELSVPGGPYALTTNSDGAPQTIAIATSSAAHRAITVTTGGGRLLISSGNISGDFGPPPLIGHQPIDRRNTHGILPAPQASSGIQPAVKPPPLP